MRKPDLRVFVPPASSSRLQQIVWRSDRLRRARLLLQVRGRNPGMDWDRPRAPLWLGLHLTRSATFCGCAKTQTKPVETLAWRSRQVHVAAAGTLSGLLKRVESEMAKKRVKTQDPSALHMRLIPLTQVPLYVVSEAGRG